MEIIIVIAIFYLRFGIKWVVQIRGKAKEMLTTNISKYPKAARLI